MRNMIFCLLVVCGIFGACWDLMFAQTPTPTPTPTPIAQPPTVTNGNIIYLDDTSVRLYGTVNPNGLPATVWAEYGTRTPYGNTFYDNTSSMQSVSGTTTQRISIDLSGLLLGVQVGPINGYSCRIAAQNSAGTSYGREQSIYSITPNFSSGVVTYDATDVTSNSAIIHGEIITVPHDIWFEFDTIEGEYFYTAYAYGTDSVYSTILSGLEPATTYYYRIAGSDKNDVHYGETKSFTTLEATPEPTPIIVIEEPEYIEISPSKLNLKKRQSSEVIVTVLGFDDMVFEGETVTATINKAGSKRISVTPTSTDTDTNGEAIFIITAKNKAGNARVTFTVDSAGWVKKSIIVKVK